MLGEKLQSDGVCGPDQELWRFGKFILILETPATAPIQMMVLMGVELRDTFCSLRGHGK